MQWIHVVDSISSRNSAICPLTPQFSIFHFLFLFCARFPARTSVVFKDKCIADVLMGMEEALPRRVFAVHSFQQEINSCAMSSKWVQKEWHFLFICYGNQCLPGDENTTHTPQLISQFLTCTTETGDRERPELRAVKFSTVTKDRPRSPRQLTPSEVVRTDTTLIHLY